MPDGDNGEKTVVRTKGDQEVKQGWTIGMGRTQVGLDPFGAETKFF